MVDVLTRRRLVLWLGLHLRGNVFLERHHLHTLRGLLQLDVSSVLWMRLLDSSVPIHCAMVNVAVLREILSAAGVDIDDLQWHSMLHQARARNVVEIASDDDAEVIAFEAQPVPEAQLVPVVCEAKLFCCASQMVSD